MRPAQNSSRSASDRLARQLVAPCSPAMASTPDQMVDLSLATVQLDDQQRLHIERIAGMDERLRRLDGELVHHLHAAGDDAGADDRGHASLAPSMLGKPSSSARAFGGLGRMRTVTSVTTPSSPSDPTITPSRS